MSRAGRQLALDLGVPPRTARRRPVQACPEAAEVYVAVGALRAVGCAVYRSGALHQVDGKLLTTAQLLGLHRAQLGHQRGEAER